MRGTRYLAAFGVLGLLLSAGCSESSNSISPSARLTTPDFGSPVEEQIAFYLEHEEMSEIQRDILKDAADRGEVSFEDVRVAVGYSFDCLREAGMTPLLDPVNYSGAYPILSYSYLYNPKLSENESSALADNCIAQNSGIVEYLYFSQPASVALEKAYWDSEIRPLVIECLVEYGVAVPDDISNDELSMLAYEVRWHPVTHEVIGPECVAYAYFGDDFF